MLVFFHGNDAVPRDDVMARQRAPEQFDASGLNASGPSTRSGSLSPVLTGAWWPGLCSHGGSNMEPLMATVTLKDLPADLHRRLKARAERNGRSLNREMIESLEASFQAERLDVDALLDKARRVRASIGATTDARITRREIDRLKREGRP